MHGRDRKGRFVATFAFLAKMLRPVLGFLTWFQKDYLPSRLSTHEEASYASHELVRLVFLRICADDFRVPIALLVNLLWHRPALGVVKVVVEGDVNAFLRPARLVFRPV